MIIRSTLVAALLMLPCATVNAQTRLPWQAEVAIPSSHRLKFTSKITGESYTIYVRVPLTPPPANGYPVIYVLDGDQYFGMASDIGLNVGGPDNPVIVGIGHGVLDDPEVIAAYAGRKRGDNAPLTFMDSAQALNTLRFHDLSLPVAPAHRAPDWTGLTPSNVGGADQFLQVIEREIKPRVYAVANINKSNQAIFGHSIAGLTVLRALFTEPTAFRSFIAASPSIWWDADAVLKDEARFRSVVESGQVAPRILLTAGGNEPESPNPPASFLATLPPDRLASLTEYLKMANTWSGMVSGARNLAARLSGISGKAGYKAEFAVFADEDHASVLPAAMSRGIQFALAH